ncbi:MAG: hypothetical protein B7O98_00575 [Zestosphaera tikiterensis]|uniref:ABC transporter n=1 Tax=Zestosphaera tikiterensis TaxID=1973259 RepID=A0A2R7Y8T1_9CREN|nr:MAG: hypothetical protein B7O98_00575 [Zestosphaera tikiterensis]
MNNLQAAITYALLSVFLALITFLMTHELTWVLTIASLAMLYGSLSPLIAARRLYYLSTASSHASLLAVSLALIITETFKVGTLYLWASLTSLTLVFGVGYLIYKGVDPDVATSAFVAATTASSVILLYYVLVNFRSVYSVNALIIGDPLLISPSEAYLALGIGLTALLTSVTTFREHVCLGIDKDILKLAGVKVYLYDVTLYGLIAVSSILLVKLVGYVLTHVMVLMPALISINVSKCACKTLINSVGLSVLISLTGLLVSTKLNIAPSGAIGLLMFLTYLTSFFYGFKVR